MTPRVSGAQCGRHREVAAVEICTRCGTFLCGECVVYRKDELPYCAECLAHFDGAAPSRRANVGLGLSIAGAVLFFPGVVVPVWPLALIAAVAGLVVSWVEVRAISRGDAPAAGVRRARAGRLIGAIAAGLMVMGIAAFIYVAAKAGWAA